MNLLDKTCKRGPKQKRDHHHQILHIQNNLGIKFQRKLKILDEINQKGDHKHKKNHHQILHIRNSPGAKFQLHKTILLFWTKFTTKKDTSSQKQKKMNINIESFIFKLVYVPIFGLN